MDNNSESISLFSPTTARTLWTIGVAIGGLTLALTLWAWARGGYDWTTFLGPVGLLLLVVSYPFVRTRGRLYLVLQMIAMGLLIADLIFMLGRW